VEAADPVGGGQAVRQEWAEVCYVPNWAGHSRKRADYRFLAIREPLRRSALGDAEKLPFLTQAFGRKGLYKLFGVVTNRKGPGDGVAFESAVALLSSYHVGFAVQLHAIAEGALEFAIDFLNSHAVAPHGRGLATDDPIIQYQVAAFAARVHASRSAVRAGALAVSRGFRGEADLQEVSAEVGMAEETATLAALDVSSDAAHDQ